MTAPPVSFYADFQGLAALRREAKTEDAHALKEAAQQFESLFTQMLLKSMREANRSFGDSLFGGSESEFYEDMFDQQIALHLSKGKGLGLAEMLIRQLSQSQGEGVDAGESAQGVTPRAGVGAQALESGVATRAPLALSREEFVRDMLPHAQRAARELGVDPHALVAQAALETGWGRFVPCTPDGRCSFNLFGVKATPAWSGPSVNVATLEFEDGLPVRRVERFRAYDSPESSFMDYARLIANSPRYEGALGAGGGVAQFAAALQEGGYATDPLYASKLESVASEVRSVAARLKSADPAPTSSGGGAS